jgi:hypothetical protein
MTSPRVLQFIEEMWPDWETDLEMWAEGFDTNVVDKMQDYLKKELNKLPSPKNSGQEQFMDKIRDFIENDINDKSSPFFNTLDTLQRSQATIAQKKVDEAKTLEQAQQIVKTTLTAQGIKVKIPTNTVSIKNNRVVIDTIYPEVSAQELPQRAEIAKDLENALQEKQVEQQQEELNQLIDEEQTTIDQLLSRALPRWEGVVEDIAGRVSDARSPRDLDSLRNDIARLPINSRKQAEKLVQLKKRELSF